VTAKISQMYPNAKQSSELKPSASLRAYPSRVCTTVSVLVQQPPVKHEVKMKHFVSWLGRQGRSPAEVILKQKLEKILDKVNHART
jgi:hypothetical protein